MRALLLAAALVTGFAAIASAEPLVQNGKVSLVDRNGKSFEATWALSGKAVYRTTDRTVVRVGTTPTNWSAVKIGHVVDVTYHLDGTTPVADEVIIRN